MRDILQKLTILEQASEQEEFEFRRRREQEAKNGGKPPAPPAPPAPAKVDSNDPNDPSSASYTNQMDRASDIASSKGKNTNQVKARPANPNVLALQKELKDAGADLGKFGPKGDGLDGQWGKTTAGAAFSDPKFTEIAKKYADKIPQVASILKTKEFAQGVKTQYEKPDYSLGSKPISPADAQSSAQAVDTTGIGRTPGAGIQGQGGTVPPAATAQDAGSEEERFKKFYNDQKQSEANARTVSQVKAMIRPQNDGNGKGYSIDPTNGIIFWSNSAGGEDKRPEPIRFDAANSNLYKDIFGLLKKAGVTVQASGPGKSWMDYGAGYASVPLDQIKQIQSGEAPGGVQSSAQKAPVGAPSLGTGLKMPASTPTIGNYSLTGSTPSSVGLKEHVQLDEIERLVSLVQYR